MESTRTLLLTGAAGFLGSRILNKCIHNYKLIILINKNYPQCAENITKVNIKQLQMHDDVDTIVHCAARISGNSKIIYDANIKLTEKLIHYCKNNNTFLVYISTLNVNMKYKSNYERTKLACEKLIKSSNIKNVIIRPSYLFDDDQEPNLKFINFIILPIIKYLRFITIPNYSAMIQPLHVMDLVSILMRIINNKTHNGDIIEIAGPKIITIIDMIAAYIKYMNNNIAVYKIPSIFVAPLSIILNNIFLKHNQNRILEKKIDSNIIQICGLNKQKYL